jgi:hypothetical protein
MTKRMLLFYEPIVGTVFLFSCRCLGLTQDGLGSNNTVRALSTGSGMHSGLSSGLSSWDHRRLSHLSQYKYEYEVCIGKVSYRL